MKLGTRTPDEKKIRRFQLRWREPLGRKECPYAYRWTLNLWLFSIRVHQWIRSDDKRFMHDHPWHFITLVVWGGYRDVSSVSGPRWEIVKGDKLGKTTMTKQIPDHIIEVLKAAHCDGNTLTLAGQLDRKVYSETMKFIEILGGKWDKKRKCHVFEDDCADRIDTAIMAGEVVDLKKMFQFFETPKALAADMCSRLTWKVGQSVLEPSAGRGRLLDAILENTPDSMSVYYCEMNQAHADYLQSEYDETCCFLCNDFMQLDKLDVKHEFDRIVMNPPFRNGQDIAHVRKAYDHLRPGGQMVAITYPAWQYRDTKKFAEFREWLKTVDHDVEDIPAGAFVESGTNIRSLMLVIRKP